MNVNTSKAVILVSTIMILIIGGIVLSSIFINSLPEDDGDSSPINPASLPFSQRWYFNASVDKTQYHHGENIILTINFTCLINHTMPYFTRYFWPADYFVLNGTKNIIQGFPQSPSLTEANRAFTLGETLISEPFSFHLATTDEENTSHDALWINYLPVGTYYLFIEPPLRFKDGPNFSLEFDVV